MSNGYTVVRKHLDEASRNCHVAASAYKASMPNAGLSPVDCGEPKLNEMLGITLRVMGQLHLQFAQGLDAHGTKIGIAANHYEQAEKNIETHIRDTLFELLERAPWDNSDTDSPGETGKDGKK